MMITKAILSAIALASIVIIGASAIEARKAQEECDRYLKSIRDRTRQ